MIDLLVIYNARKGTKKEVWGVWLLLTSMRTVSLAVEEDFSTENNLHVIKRLNAVISQNLRIVLDPTNQREATDIELEITQKS